MTVRDAMLLFQTGPFFFSFWSRAVYIHGREFKNWEEAGYTGSELR